MLNRNCLAAFALVVSSLAASAQTIPDIQLVPIATGFHSPVQVVSSHDGSGRLFVVEQAGDVRVLDRSPAQNHGVFLAMKEKVTSGGEMGLLGLAFHPDFKNNRRFFVDYTTTRAGQLYTHVSELHARADLSVAYGFGERVLLRVAQPYPNHNGGLVLFGPDGDLYVGLGDGGSGNDPHNNGQSLNTLLGKILRIDVSASSASQRYASPPDNPFVGQGSARPEIFAYGLRNPWRFSFDAQSGLLYCGDVGQDTREEIDVVRKGGNYGWRIMEGTICTPGVDPNCNTSGLLLPILDYGHDIGQCVTGGFVYRGSAYPELQGVYLYADYVAGRIWGLRYDGNQVVTQRLLLESGQQICSFGEDDAHELYAVSYGGTIFQITKP